MAMSITTTSICSGPEDLVDILTATNKTVVNNKLTCQILRSIDIDIYLGIICSKLLLLYLTFLDIGSLGYTLSR